MTDTEKQTQELARFMKLKELSRNFDNDDNLPCHTYTNCLDCVPKYCLSYIRAKELTDNGYGKDKIMDRAIVTQGETWTEYQAQYLDNICELQNGNRETVRLTVIADSVSQARKIAKDFLLSGEIYSDIRAVIRQTEVGTCGVLVNNTNV